MKKDIKAAGILENTWYKEALHREKWHQGYNKSITEGDKVRHKCPAERMKPIKALLSARHVTNGSEARVA